MPCGIAKESLPFGPCTSILPPCMAIFTPEGTAIGLCPIRDICSSSLRILLRANYALPNLAQKFAADFGLARRAAAHQPLWRSQNADAQPAHDRLDLPRAAIRARARARNALAAADHAAAVRRVLQEDTQHLARLVFIH